jgi:hypothetical protein
MWTVCLYVRPDGVTMSTVSLYDRLNDVLQCELCASMSGWTVCYNVYCVPVCQTGGYITTGTVSLYVRLNDVLQCGL